MPGVLELLHSDSDEQVKVEFDEAQGGMVAFDQGMNSVEVSAPVAVALARAILRRLDPAALANG